jgi:hypothetical protein
MTFTYRFKWSDDRLVTEIKTDQALPNIAIGNRMMITADSEQANDVVIKDILVSISHLSDKLVAYGIDVTIEKVNLVSEGHTL